VARYERDKPKRLAAMAAYAAANPARVRDQGSVVGAESGEASGERCAGERGAGWRVVKPTVCEGCGAEKRLHGHHEDYGKPLEVRWLCGMCHKARHREMLEEASGSRP
jgi:hypothetical protein